MRITILYDNRAQAPAKEGWGFSALVEVRERKILFDTGADRLVLEHNVRHLEVELSKLTDLFLSHPHCDHVGGLSHVLEKAKGVHIWAPYVMGDYLRPRTRRAKAELTLVKGPRCLGEGLWSTGTMGRGVKEQGLVVATEEGPVLITGCAHPGIVRMAARAAKIVGERFRLVLGGFHLARLSPDELARLAEDLQALAVSVAPGHCTGREASETLLTAFPEGQGLSVGLSLELP